MFEDKNRVKDIIKLCKMIINKLKEYLLNKYVLHSRKSCSRAKIGRYIIIAYNYRI